MGYRKISTVPEDPEAKRDRWRARFREIQNEIWSDHPQPDAVPDHLYHYSSLSNIRRILSSRELWLFDVCTMQNDPGDGGHWIEVFHSVLRRKILPDWVAARFQPGNTLGLGSEWYDYVSCFSPESELQEQWEEFADHGRGCAIELAFPKFIDASDAGTEYGWVPMFYDAKEQKIRAEKTVDKAIELYCAEVADMSPQDARLDYWIEAVFSFLLCGTRFKDPKFERQREWRIFLSKTSEDIERVRYLGSRRYIPWPFPAGVVTALIKGPNCDCPNEELERLLTASGYPAKVRNAHP